MIATYIVCFKEYRRRAAYSRVTKHLKAYTMTLSKLINSAIVTYSLIDLRQPISFLLLYYGYKISR